MNMSVELDRPAILSLIAMGRITPSQAERLLAVSVDGDDAILKFAVFLRLRGSCFGKCTNWRWARYMRFRWLRRGWAELAQSVVACVTQVCGGV
ncbi:MAG TPA: hypothetical protein VH369_05745 [Bryobacteraceae bacterium]|jgi:hypothetical protein